MISKFIFSYLILLLKTKYQVVISKNDDLMMRFLFKFSDRVYDDVKDEKIILQKSSRS